MYGFTGVAAEVNYDDSMILMGLICVGLWPLQFLPLLGSGDLIFITFEPHLFEGAFHCMK